MQKDLSNFESNLSHYLKSKFSVGVGNATDGMKSFFKLLYKER